MLRNTFEQFKSCQKARIVAGAEKYLKRRAFACLICRAKSRFKYVVCYVDSGCLCFYLNICGVYFGLKSVDFRLIVVDNFILCRYLLVKVGYLGVVTIKLSLHIGNLIEQIVYGRLIIADFIIIGIYFAFKLVYLILHGRSRARKRRHGKQHSCY